MFSGGVSLCESGIQVGPLSLYIYLSSQPSILSQSKSVVVTIVVVKIDCALDMWEAANKGTET